MTMVRVKLEKTLQSRTGTATRQNLIKLTKPFRPVSRSQHQRISRAKADQSTMVATLHPRTGLRTAIYKKCALAPGRDNGFFGVTGRKTVIRCLGAIVGRFPAPVTHQAQHLRRFLWRGTAWRVCVLTFRSKIGLVAINKTRSLLQNSAGKLRRALGRNSGTDAPPRQEIAHNVPPNFCANPEHAAGKQAVLIGTHHKTGTVWLERVFQMLCRYSGSQFVDINPEVNSAVERSAKLSDAACSDSRTFLYDHHSRFEDIDFGVCARLHVVRDPRDIIVSGMRYHMRSNESWLHQPDTRLDGLTYQQKLLSFSNDADRYRFEYENIAGSTIAEIEKIEQRWDFLTFRYEDLIADTGLEHWRRLFESAGLEGDEIIVGLVAAWQNSLFGAMKPELSEHIHSGGASRWISELPSGLANEVSNTHKELIYHLGY